MKLALARAILQKAQILLLDEPTNHLDTTNVAWLNNYLISLTVRGVQGCKSRSAGSDFMQLFCTRNSKRQATVMCERCLHLHAC